MAKYLLEVCVDSVESALAAAAGGADRLELCSNLIIGGTTPSESLYREIRKYTDIPIHVLIRPRFGDFCYTDHEFAVICDEVKRFKELGVQGVVIGILKSDGALDADRLSVLMDIARDLPVTLHRAFDVCVNPKEALEQAINLGFTTILTSGQKNSCIEGTALLSELQNQAAGRIHLLAGAGISADVVADIYEKTGITQYHMSGKKVLDSSMHFRKEDVAMGLPGFSEYEIYRTDEAEVRRAKEVLETIGKNKYS